MLPFLGSLILIGLSIFLSLHYPPQFNTYFYLSVLPFIGIALSALSFFIGHFSYPRVHNLKVYLIGYLAGLIGLGYFLLYRVPGVIRIPQAPRALRPLFTWLLSLIFCRCCSFHLLSSTGPQSASFLVVMPVECIFLLIFRFSPIATGWAGALFFHGLIDPAFYLGILFFLLTLSISIWRIQDEFYLGGILAGSGLALWASWISRMYFSSFQSN